MCFQGLNVTHVLPWWFISLLVPAPPLGTWDAGVGCEADCEDRMDDSLCRCSFSRFISSSDLTVTFSRSVDSRMQKTNNEWGILSLGFYLNTIGLPVLFWLSRTIFRDWVAFTGGLMRDAPLSSFVTVTTKSVFSKVFLCSLPRPRGAPFFPPREFCCTFIS